MTSEICWNWICRYTYISNYIAASLKNYKKKNLLDTMWHYCKLQVQEWLCVLMCVYECLWVCMCVCVGNGYVWVCVGVMGMYESGVIWCCICVNGILKCLWPWCYIILLLGNKGKGEKRINFQDLIVEKEITFFRYSIRMYSLSIQKLKPEKKDYLQHPIMHWDCKSVWVLAFQK